MATSQLTQPPQPPAHPLLDWIHDHIATAAPGRADDGTPYLDLTLAGVTPEDYMWFRMRLCKEVRCEQQ